MACKHSNPLERICPECQAERIASAVKRCGTCREIKAKSEFGSAPKMLDGLRPRCKLCHNARNRDYRERNPEMARQSSRNWVARNRKRASEKVCRWAKTEKGKATRRKWAERNREHSRSWLKRHRQNIDHRLHHAMSTRLNLTINGKAGRRSRELLGFNTEELRRHLERQFTQGMSWENYGAWHVDHIVPLASFVIQGPDDPELRRAWALTNLRPLWAEDNRRKHAKRVFLI